MPDYLKNRLKDQISWYSDKASLNKWLWYGSRFITLLLSAIIIYSGYYAENWEPKLVGSIGIFILISEGIQGICKFHEKWMNYRTTSESLKHQKNLFENKAGSYGEIPIKEAKKILVEKCESLISGENSQWVDVCKK